jgi:hypothetical protein
VLTTIDAPAANGYTGTIWAIRYSNDVYFVAGDEAARNEVVTALNIPTTTNINDICQKYTAETDGKLYTFYYVFVAKNEADAMSVYRNTVYDVVVKSVLGLGQPGDEIKPSDPDEPVLDTPTDLDVEITITPWTYIEAETVLG